MAPSSTIETSAQRRYRLCRRFAVGAGVVPVVCAVAVLAGWLFDLDLLKSVIPGAATMKPLAALCLAVSGLSVWLLATAGAPQPGRWSRSSAARLGGALAASVGALTLIEYLLGADLGVSGLLFPQALAASGLPHPGRMAVATALGFLVLGVALGGLGRHRPVRTVDQLLAMAALVLGGLVVEGYVFGVESLYHTVAYSSMAMHTAVLFVVLGAGAICSRPDESLMAVVNSEASGGFLARRLLPLVVILPAVAGWLRWQGELAGWYETAFGLVLLIAVNSLLFAGLVWLNALRLNAIDARRQQAESELRTSQANLLAALEAGGMGTWVWDVERDVMTWDDSVLKLWGVSRDLLPGTGFAAATALLLPEDQQRFRAALEGLLHGGGSETADELRTVLPDGSVRWNAVSGRLARDGEGKPLRLTGVVLDITARKRTDEALLRSQKLEALGTLAGGIAHDFNNILLAITGNAKLALEDLAADHPARESLLEIDKAGARAAGLVRRILAFSRPEDHRREPLQLRPVVEEALRLVRATLPAMIEIRADLEGEVPAVLADANQIHQIVVNLATNALHAIEPNPGRIELRLDSATLGVEQAHALESLAPGRYVELTVADDGCGMSRETLARIFDPFFTTKPTGTGTGLGLSIVHGIMKRHNGAVTVSSEEGRGTRFQLYFPAIESSTGSPAPSYPW